MAKVPLGESFTPHANRILAAVRDALLSDEAVEASEVAYLGTAIWDFTETMVVEGELGTIPEILAAALDAAGITEANDDD